MPPAPLFLAEKTAARDVEDLQPMEPVSGSVRAETVAEWGGGLAVYTAVHAPAGLRQAIEHVWRKNGQVIARVPLSPVLGGRARLERATCCGASLRHVAPKPIGAGKPARRFLAASSVSVIRVDPTPPPAHLCA